MTQTLRDSDTEILNYKKVSFFFHGVREIKLLQDCFGWSFLNWWSLLVCFDWLGVYDINYCVFRPLAGGFGQFPKFIVSLHVLVYVSLHYCPASPPLFTFIILWQPSGSYGFF